MALSSSSRVQNEIQNGVETADKQQAAVCRKISGIANETGGEEEKDTEQAELAGNETIVPPTGMNMEALEMTAKVTSDMGNVKPYPRLPVFAANYDAPFKVKTAALIFLRAMNLTPDHGNIAFQLAANVRGAGHLGDLVLKLSYTSKFSAIFLQLKPTAKLVVSRAMLTDQNSCFPLQTYFQSYREIKKSMSSAEKGSLFDLGVGDCVFATYTNARGARKLGSEQGKTFTVLSMESAIHSYCKGALYHRFSQDSDNILGECLREEGADGMKFLSRFRIFTGQPKVNELDALVRDELRKIDSAKYLDLDVGRLCACFLENVKEWWEKDGVVLDKDSDILERARMAMNKV